MPNESKRNESQKSGAMLQEAERLLSENNFYAALELYNAALALDPTNVGARQRIADIEELLVDSPRQVLTAIAESARTLLGVDRSVLRIPWAVETGEHRTPGESEDLTGQEWAPYASQEGVHSMLAVPIMQGGARLGILVVHSNSPREYNQEDSRLLRIFADQAAQAISRAGILPAGEPLTIESHAPEPTSSRTLSEITLVTQGVIRASSVTQPLTPSYLGDTLAVFLGAIADLQQIIDELRKQKPGQVLVKSIRQQSPISVSLDGAADAIQVVKESIVPWRRKHAATMADLAEDEKRAEIDIKRAEILEKQALAAKDTAEAEKSTAAALKLREEAEQMHLTNEQLRLDLYRAKVQLALDVIGKIAPDLTEADRIAYVIRLLPPLSVLVGSGLEISSDESGVA